MKKKSTTTLYVKIGPKGKRDPNSAYWTVPYTRAKGNIPIRIEPTKELIKTSKRGLPFECVLAMGIAAAVKANPKTFPHDFKFAYVNPTTIYIVDTFKGGQPGHAWRYEHSFGKMAKTFDTITEDEFVKKFEGKGFILNLRKGRKYRGGESKIGGNGTGGTRSHRLSRGALGRAQAAGLLPATL